LGMVNKVRSFPPLALLLSAITSATGVYNGGANPGGITGYRASTNILMHWLADAMAHSYCGTSYFGYRRPVELCEQPDRPVVTHGYEGGAERGYRTPVSLSDRMITDNRSGLIPGSAHCTEKPRGSGWDSGGLNCPTHVLLRSMHTTRTSADASVPRLAGFLGFIKKSFGPDAAAPMYT
jgi:hypothetical protein